MNQPWIYMFSPSWSPLLPPSPSHPSGSSQCTRPEHLSHASNLGWWSVSSLTVYLFQCYSLRISHPHLLPQSLKVCTVHLCLFFCFAYRVIVTIFIYPFFVDGHLGCFHLSANLNNTTMNTGGQISPMTSLSVLLGVHSEVGFLNHDGNFSFGFLEEPPCFIHSNCTILCS